MRISDLSIRNAVFSWMLFSAFIIFGFISFMRLGVSQLPDVDFPVVNVSVSLVGAAPEIMETSVVDPIEDALSSVEGVDRISSVSKTGVANITIEFELDRNIDTALQEVQTKVAQAQRLLPKNVDPPVISKTNPDDQPILWLALTYDKNDSYFLMTYAKDYLKDRFTIIPGVGDVILGGYTDPAMRVSLSADKLRRHNISVKDVQQSIDSQHAEIPGGFIQNRENSFNVRTLGEFKDAKGFENLIINRRAGLVVQNPFNVLRLKDLGTAKEGLSEIYRLSRFDGIPALGIGIKKQLGSNAVGVANAVKERLDEIRGQLPPGMNIHINFDSSRFIERAITEMIKHLVLAVILTALVCLVFLGSFTATLNVLLAIPTSIMGAFIGLYFFGFTLNTFTLLGLTLAIGIVVDDAIMVLENIFRYNEKGLNPIQSAIVGAREIAFAALAATISVMAIFLPVAFMTGVIGKFFLQYGITISLAVALSLLESLTITPMRCSSFVHQGTRSSRAGQAFESFMEAWKRFYSKSLNWTLNHRWKVLIGSIVFVILSFYSVGFLNKEMTPIQDQGLFILRFMLPVGSSLDKTNSSSREIEKWLLARPEILHVYAAIGGFGSAGGSDANTGVMFVTLKDKQERGSNKPFLKNPSQQEFMNYARKELSQVSAAKVYMLDLSTRGFSTGRGYPIEFVLQGPEWDKLAELNETLKAEMRESGLMEDIDSDYLEGMPEIQVTPKRDQAARRGVSIDDIGNAIQALIGGVRNGQYTKAGHRYDIYIQLEKVDDPTQNFKKLLIANDRNNLISLSKISEVTRKASLQQVTRVNRQRAVTLYANLKTGASQEKALAFIQQKSKQLLPPTYFITQSGAAKTFQESFYSLIFALILGILIAYMVLASQFNSFLDPVTILMALPFSFSGAFFALILMGQTINMYSMIGILLLMGIVKKNSILLVDFTNAVRDRKNGVTADQALKEACPVRLRPIIMTSFATIAAAIPSALATGAGSETYKPMAVTLIGGVLVSTFLTLYVVPATYSLMERFRKRDTRRKQVAEAFEEISHNDPLKFQKMPEIHEDEATEAEVLSEPPATRP